MRQADPVYNARYVTCMCTQQTCELSTSHTERQG